MLYVMTIALKLQKTNLSPNVVLLGLLIKVMFLVGGFWLDLLLLCIHMHLF